MAAAKAAFATILVLPLVAIVASAPIAQKQQYETISDGLDAFNWVQEPSGGEAISCYHPEPPATSSNGSSSNSSGVYFVVLDAGSTGTRAVAHRFLRNPASRLGFDHLGFTRHKRNPGLSSFARFPRRCRRQLELLLAAVAKDVPRGQRAKTCLLLRATAGLRLMNARARYMVAKEVRAVLLGSDFQSLGLETVRMLDGSEEAKFTWLSVNYLLGNFRDAEDRADRQSGSHGTKPVIEMGGGSLQIAYETPDGDQSLAPIRRQGGDHGSRLRLRARSYLGLGIHESILRFVGHKGLDGSDENLTASSYQTACLADNLTLNFTFGSVKVQLVGRAGSRAGNSASPPPLNLRPSNSSDCMTRALSLTARIGVREELQLRSNKHRQNWPVYAISGVYHLLEFLYKQQASIPGIRVNFTATACPAPNRCKAYAITVGEVTLAAAAVCRDMPRDGPFKPYYCINLAVTSALLQGGGMGLPDGTPLVALGKQEALGWTLGLSLEYLRASIDANCGVRPTGLFWVWCCSVLASLIARRL